MIRTTTPLAVRFARHVCYTDDLFSCWLWTGSTKPSGYGEIGGGTRHTPTLKAHRVAWVLAYGPIPPGLSVCHHCDTPRCVRPDHLFLGTHAANMADMAIKGRAEQKLTPADVTAIRASTDSQTALARRYRVHQATIWEILRRRIWKHVA